MTVLAVSSVSERTMPSMVWAFVLRVVEYGRPGQVYTYIHRGSSGTTEYVVTPGGEWSAEATEDECRSLVMAARTKAAGTSSLRSLAFRRQNGAWVKSGR